MLKRNVIVWWFLPLMYEHNGISNKLILKVDMYIMRFIIVVNKWIKVGILKKAHVATSYSTIALKGSPYNKQFR